MLGVLGLLEGALREPRTRGEALCDERWVGILVVRDNALLVLIVLIVLGLVSLLGLLDVLEG